jgi:hypothetical protein
MSKAAIAAAATEILKPTALTLLEAGTNLFINAFDKVGFDLDTTGRARETKMIEEQIRSAFENEGWRVNIAIWNMHINEDHHFNDIVVSKLSPMGKGGGFRVVVFLGSGWIRNDGDRGFENWLCSGNQEQSDNIIRFQSQPKPRLEPQPSPGPTFTLSNAPYVFTSHHGSKLRCNDDGSVDLAPHAKAWELWSPVWQGGNRYAWKSIYLGNYLTAWDDGTVQSKPELNAWEVWEHIHLGNGMNAWKSAHGTYLSVWPDGDVKLAPHIKEWEQWH